MSVNSKEIKPKVSCINLGYYQVKASGDISFKSKAKSTIDDKNLASGDVIEFNGKNYIMEIGQPMLDSDKTANDLTKIFVLNVLAKQYDEQENAGNFNVLLTSPPISFKKQSQDLPKFLEGEYKIKYNGKPMTINIKKVVVLPETFLVYTVNNPSKLKGKKTLIIDIGGRTTNVCLLTDCKFSLDDYFTISKGMYNIDQSIAKKINTANYTSYNDEDIDLLRKQNARVLDDNKELIEEVYREHVDSIVKEVSINSWQIDNNTVILICGGGGIILEEYIQESFPNAKLSNDPLYDNLKALELMSKEVFK
jgi:hypothetical protein